VKNIDDVILSGVNLHCLDENNKPISIGTGCIIDMPDCDYLLTVFHVANKKDGRLAILSEYVEGKGQEYVVLGDFTYQCFINTKTGKRKDIEFAFAKIPYKYDYFYQEISPIGIVNRSKRIKKFKLHQIKEPSVNNNYGFAGHTQPSIIDNYAFQTHFIHHLDYKYNKTEGWAYIFEPPIEHPGHKYYKGYSGAPIVDENNNIVSLVICEDIGKNEIYGIDFEKAMIGFKFEIGIIKGK
jgi:hypothetical protein